MTTTAATTLAAARAENGLPEHFGVRISAASANSSQAAFQFGFVEEPLAGDQVTETEGTRVFVAEEVAAPLDDAVLDVEDTGRLILTPAT
ncbi:MAG: Fe-S cluster assembly protein HesB [Acidimicrobiia bacterium]